MTPAVAEGVRRLRASLVVVGPPESLLLEAARDAGLPVAAEGFADRLYMPDGTLVPRREPDALLSTAEEAAEQAVSIVRDGLVRARDGSTIRLRVQTICLHGDTPGAVEYARRIQERFREEGIGIAPFDITPSRDRRAQAAAPLF